MYLHLFKMNLWNLNHVENSHFRIIYSSVLDFSASLPTGSCFFDFLPPCKIPVKCKNLILKSWCYTLKIIYDKIVSVHTPHITLKHVTAISVAKVTMVTRIVIWGESPSGSCSSKACSEGGSCQNKPLQLLYVKTANLVPPIQKTTEMLLYSSPCSFPFHF